MDDTQPSRTSDAAAATRKRRSSILKSQRPSRAPLSELEFNVATPTDTAKSRRVSFSRRTGVAEFVTNEATTTWKNFYEEHNKTLESSGNDSEVKPPRPSVGHLGKRIFEQQFEEVEAIDFGSTLDDGRGRNIETSLNNVNFAEQLVSLDGTADDKLTAPYRNFELSTFTDHQSKLFRDDLAMSGLGEITDRISVNFSVVQTIGDPKKDDLDEIEIDIARAQSNTRSQGNVVCQGPFRDRGDLSEYIEVDLNMTHVGLRNDESDMSITDTINSPKVQDVSKSNSSVRNNKNNAKDWVEDKENILVNPYVTPKETANFAINEDSDKILVFDGKRLTVQSEIDPMPDRTDYPHTMLPNSKPDNHQRKTIVLNVNDDLPNFGVDLHASMSVLKGNHTILDNNDISMTQPLNIKMEVNTEKRKTVIFGNDTGDISITQAVPNVILPEVKDKRKTIVYESDSGNISVTEAVPSNLIMIDHSFLQVRRKTIVFEADEGNISITQAVPANIFGSNPQPDKRRTIVFETDTEDLSVTEVVPSKIMQEKQSTSQYIDQIHKTETNVDTRHFEKVVHTNLKNMMEKTTMYNEQEGSKTYKAMDNTKHQLEIEVDVNTTHVGLRNEKYDMSVTDTIKCPKVQAVYKSSSSLQNDRSNVKDWVDNKENKLVNPYVTPKETASFSTDEDSGKILVFDGKRLTFQSEKDPVPDRIDYHHTMLPNSQPDKNQRKSSVLNGNDDLFNFADEQHASMSVFKGNDTMVYKNNISMTQPLNAKLEVQTEKRKTVVFENDTGDISITQAIPNVILSELKDKRKTIVYESECGDISVTEAVPSNLILTDQSFAQGRLPESKDKRKTIVYESDCRDISVTEAVPSNLILTDQSFAQGRLPELKDKRKTIVYESDCGDISVTEAVSSNLILTDQSFAQGRLSELKDKRKTIVYESDCGDISVTEAVPSNLILTDQSFAQGRRKTIVFEDDEANISITQAVPANFFRSNPETVKRRTIVFDSDTRDISVTEVGPSKILQENLNTSQIRDQISSSSNKYLEKVGNTILKSMIEKKAMCSEQEESKDYKAADSTNELLEMLSQFTDKDEQDNQLESDERNPVGKNISQIIEKKKLHDPLESDEIIPVGNNISQIIEKEEQDNPLESDNKNPVGMNISQFTDKDEQDNPLKSDEMNPVGKNISQFIEKEELHNSLKLDEINPVGKNISHFIEKEELHNSLESDEINPVGKNVSQFIEKEEQDNPLESDEQNSVGKNISKFIEQEELHNPLESDEKTPLGMNISQFTEKEEQDNPLKSDAKNLVGKNISQFTEKEEQDILLKSDKENSVGKNISQFIEKEEQDNPLESDEKNIEHQDNLFETDEKNPVGKNILKFIEMKKQHNPLETEEKNPFNKNISQFIEKKEPHNPFELNEKNTACKKKASSGQMSPIQGSTAHSSPILRRRPSVVLSREDLLSNISMAQAILQKSRMDISDTEDMQDNDVTGDRSPSPRKNVHLTPEVIKTLRFDDDTLTDSFNVDAASALRETAVGETGYMKDKTYVIPSKLTDVSDGIKARIGDLVKPEVETMPLDAGKRKDTLEAASTTSAQVQASFISSSQINLDTEMNSNASSTRIVNPSLASSMARTMTGIMNIVNPSAYTLDGSIVNGSPASDAMPVPSQIPVLQPKRVEDKNAESKILEKIPIVSDTLSKTGEVQISLSNSIAVVSPSGRSNDQGIVTPTKSLKETEVNTIISMKGAKNLLEASSYLMLVDDSCKALEAIQSQDSSFKVLYEQPISPPAPKLIEHADCLPVDSASRKRVYSPTKREEHQHCTSKLDVTPKPASKMQKRSLSPDGKASNIPAVLNRKLRTTSMSSPSQSPEKSYSKSPIKSSLKSPQGDSPSLKSPSKSPMKYSLGSPPKSPLRSKSPSMSPLKFSLKSPPKSPSKSESPSTSKSLAETKPNSSERKALKKSSKTLQLANGYYTESVDELKGQILDVNCKSEKPPQVAVRQSEMSSFTSDKGKSERSGRSESKALSSLKSEGSPMDWQPELIKEPSSRNLVTESVNVVAKIDMLPFMGTRECEWDASSGDTWAFLLLHGRLRLSVRLGHRQGNALRSCVRADTPVLAVMLEDSHHSGTAGEKNPVAGLCVRFAGEAMRRVVGRIWERAGQVPALLRRCAGIARLAMRWGNAMHDARTWLAYTLGEDGCLTLKVANIPLRSVWEVTMRLELTTEEMQWPRATDVCVHAVVADAKVLPAEVHRVLAHVPHDWGHVPRSIWKIFKYLKNKTRDDETLLGL